MHKATWGIWGTPLEIVSFLAGRILIQYMSKCIEIDLVLVYADST